MTATITYPTRLQLPPTIRALRDASTLLAAPCTDCRCYRPRERDLDPDPECPGLRGDGCRTDTRIRARLALAGVGITGTVGSRLAERMAVQAALDFLHRDLPDLILQHTPDPTARATTGDTAADAAAQVLADRARASA